MKRLCLKRLGLVGVIAISGCVIDPPAELQEPTLRAPDFIEASAVPLPRFPLYTTEQTTASFRVHFIADEGGGPLKGALYLNYGVNGREAYLGTGIAQLIQDEFANTGRDAAPSAPTPFPVISADDPQPASHTITVEWKENKRLDPGCYQVTLAVTYANNFDENGVRPTPGALTSTMTWWVAHGIQPHEVSLENCRPPEPIEAMMGQGGAQGP